MPFDTTVSVYVSRKLNLGNYESADVFVKWDGVPLTVGEEFMMNASRVTSGVIDTMLDELERKAKIVREMGRGLPREDEL